MTVKETPAEIKSGDILKATYELKYKQHAFLARVMSGRAEFYLSGQSEPFGYIRPGSPTSGAIWIGNECIGEYEERPGHLTTVTPVRAGRKQPESTVEIDPVTFLLHAAVERAKTT